MRKLLKTTYFPQSNDVRYKLVRSSKARKADMSYSFRRTGFPTGGSSRTYLSCQEGRKEKEKEEEDTLELVEQGFGCSVGGCFVADCFVVAVVNFVVVVARAVSIGVALTYRPNV